MKYRPILAVASVAAVSALFAAAQTIPAAASPATHGLTSTGGVYVLSNQPTGNAVIAYDRAANGTLHNPRQYPTGGNGTGAGLGSQNAVISDESGRHLYAVNAGSDSITSFDVTRHGLRLNSIVSSGGDQPVSVSTRKNILYVLNAGGDGNVAGFSVRDGHLKALSGSVRPLSGPGTAPAQVSISPSGRQLVVTEKATSLIDVYNLDGAGRATSRVSVPSAGTTPFGFDFTRTGQLAVSEAGPSAASTYALRHGGLNTVSASVLNTEAAACWLVVTDNGRFAYTGNGGGSQSISGYRVNSHGVLSLLTADGKTASTTGGVSDIALGGASRYLYARVGDGTVGAFRINGDGSLAALQSAAGLPANAVGIAAI